MAATLLSQAKDIDLSRWLVIVPSQEAGRRLREALIRQAVDKGHGGLFPPTVLTPAGLANWGLDRHAVADDLQAMLAWVTVIDEAHTEAMPALFPMPFEKDLAWCRDFARAMVSLRKTLGEAGASFADVATTEEVPERARWRALAQLEQAWIARLAQHDLRDRESIRQALASKPSLNDSFDKIFLAATPDLTPLAVQRLQTEADAGMPIDVLVAADEAMLAPGFDRWGRPRQDYWSQHTLDTEEFNERLHVCRDPARQASVAAAWIERSTLGKIAIGLLDPSLNRLLSSRLAEAAVEVYDPEGEPFTGDALIVALRTLNAYLTDASTDNAGELLRCPDILGAVSHRWNQRQQENKECNEPLSESRPFDEARLLRTWDKLQQDHLPSTLAEMHAALKRVRASDDDREKRAKTGSEINDAIWFLEEIQRSFERLPLPEALDALFKALHGWRTFDRDAEDSKRLFDTLAQVSEAVATATTFLANSKGRIRATDVLSMALDSVSAQRHYEPSPEDPEVVPLQGWLELLWEDKPHLLLTGFNEGKVPETITSDAFLPESLRTLMGLSTNEQRYARDAYLFWAIQNARLTKNGGRVDMVLGQMSSSGDPLRPSRLLLQCEDGALAERVKQLFTEDSSEKREPSWQAAWQLGSAPLRLPDEWEARLERGLSVTALRDYLTCPFRFYLKHVLRMQAIDPFKMELDALDFGNLVHEALEAFGRDPSNKDSTDPQAITAFLHAEVDRWMADRYGKTLSVPMRQQQEAAKARLAKLAQVQAGLAHAGWRIDEVELTIHKEMGDFRINDLPLRGVIDRIESRGPDNDRSHRVVDYKTTDSPVYNPDKVTRNAHFRPLPRTGLPGHLQDYACFNYDPHGTGARTFYWTDLQLPLYCLAMNHARGVRPSWAHFRVSKRLEDIRLYEEPWDDTLMVAARHCAEGVVADIRAARFHPVAERVLFDNYERLILGRPQETVGGLVQSH